jgi:hypothetical protein
VVFRLEEWPAGRLRRLAELWPDPRHAKGNAARHGFVRTRRRIATSGDADHRQSSARIFLHQLVNSGGSQALENGSAKQE